jgi:hypothetical protein
MRRTKRKTMIADNSSPAKIKKIGLALFFEKQSGVKKAWLSYGRPLTNQNTLQLIQSEQAR